MRLIRAAAVLLLLVPSAFSQEKVPSLGETIEVNVVNVDVVVIDKQGNRVRGLKQSDFEIREDGKPQPISNFSEYVSSEASSRVAGSPVSSTAEPAAEDSRAPNARSEEDRRHIVIFVERCRLPKWDAESMFGSLKEMVRKVVRPGDEASIVFWDRALEVKQDFTDDVGALVTALDELQEINTRVTMIEAQSIEERQQEQDRIDQAVAGMGGRSIDVMSMDSRMLAKRAFMQIRAKSYAMRSLINLLAPSRGRKILITGMRRFSQYAGAEFYPGAEPPPVDKSELDTRELRKSVADAANASGVTIYPVYPIGLENSSALSAENMLGNRPAERIAQSNSFPNAVLINESFPNEELARATGGLAAWGGVDIAQMIPQMIEDLGSYYSLGYRAPSSKKRQRNISVRTINPDYRVRSRSSYVEKNDNERMSDRVISQLFRPQSENTLAIAANLGAPKTSGKRVTVPLRVRIPIANLTMLPQGGMQSGAFTVFAAAGGSRIGVSSDVIQKTQPFQIPERDVARAKKSHYTYDLTVVTDGGAESVAVGVLDEVSKQFGVIRVPLASGVRRP